jgi:hypothetical protein
MKIFNNKFKTNPVILHRPGPNWHDVDCDCCLNCKIWKNINSNFFSKKYAYDKPGDVTILTWSNKKEKQILEKCLDHLGFEYICLGKDIKNWKNTDKILTLYEYAKYIKTEYVFGLDCFDVLVLGNLQHAINEFKSLECEMLFNSSPQIYPENSNASIEMKIAPPESNFIYLNAGCWMAKTCFILKIINKLRFYVLTAQNKNSEQYFMRKIFNKNYKEIKIDYCMNVFQAGLWNNINL